MAGCRMFISHEVGVINNFPVTGDCATQNSIRWLYTAGMFWI